MSLMSTGSFYEYNTRTGVYCKCTPQLVHGTALSIYLVSFSILSYRMQTDIDTNKFTLGENVIFCIAWNYLYYHYLFNMYVFFKDVKDEENIALNENGFSNI